EPSLDESCGRHQLLGPRGVIRDQAFGEDSLIEHPPKDRGGRLTAGDLQELLEPGLVALGDAPFLAVLARLLECALGLLEALPERRGIERAGLVRLLYEQQHV